ncbi:hypothetical protein GCM10010403_26910 [Glycomyces rutgersensis]|uniref:Transposase n=1 Tax=Glycomyces rutgersensis TaxID=58115 RepID=A0ABP5SKU4_9ACTN
MLEERAREPVVLGLSPLHPRDPVEQQRPVVARGQAAQLTPGAVEHDAAQAPHLGIDTESRRVISTHDLRVDARGTKINLSLLTWTD